MKFCSIPTFLEQKSGRNERQRLRATSTSAAADGDACCANRPLSAPAPRAAAPPGAPESPSHGAPLDRVIRAEAAVARRTSGR